MSYADGSYDPMSARRTEESAPAFDNDGTRWWNVWVTGESASPYAFPTHAEAFEFAEGKVDAGLRVDTDFD